MVCLRGSRVTRRTLDTTNIDLSTENTIANITLTFSVLRFRHRKLIAKENLSSVQYLKEMTKKNELFSNTERKSKAHPNSKILDICNCIILTSNVFILSAHQVIVETLGTMAKRSVDPLPKQVYGYKESKRVGSRFYVAAEFRGTDVPAKFVLGDRKHYEGYYNAPLEPSTRYRVYVRGVTKDGNGVSFLS